MKSVRQLRLERLSTAAAEAGERGASVLEMATFFNVFYEDRCAVDNRHVPNSNVLAILSCDDCDNAGRGDNETNLGANSVAVKATDATSSCHGAGETNPSTHHIGAFKETLLVALAPSYRLDQFYALGKSVATKVVTAVRHMYSGNRDGSIPEQAHEDPTLKTLLRLAIQLEDARLCVAASDDDNRQLRAVCAQIRALEIDANASATAHNFYDQLVAMAANAIYHDEMNSEAQVVHEWV